MPVDKRDLATAFVLSLVFFSIATWGLGVRDVPLSAWQASEGKSFYIDLESPKKVSEICVLLKRGGINFEVYTGHPGSWDKVGTASMYGYYHWIRIGINRETRFVRFVFERSFGEVAEVAVLGEGSQKIVVKTVRGENGEDEDLRKLIDEQEKSECPPTYMSSAYFDEIYYVRAAEDYINLKDPYEWTHPPLGKLIMAAGILIFGYNPFGWRIMGVIFATLMIPVIYSLGKRMFGTRIGAFIPAFLLVFDFMHFTMGRMATVDTFAVFFSLTSQLFFFIYFQEVLRKGWKVSIRPLFLAVLFFSLGFSTKWYTLYGFVAQIFLLLALRIREISAFKEEWMARVRVFFSHPFLPVLGFMAIAASVYLLTFVPYMIIGHTLRDVYDRQWSMYIYHSTLVAAHPFSSQWWSWPVMLRPVWLHFSDLPGEMVSTIAAMGNPAIWWFGLGSIISAVEKTIRERDHVCSFIVTFFFLQWLPYALITRCLFLYHFYVNVPMLILATTYFLNESWGRGRGKVIGLAYLIGAAALFVLFYPVISGYPTSSWWRDSLKWFKSWMF